MQVTVTARGPLVTYNCLKNCIIYYAVVLPACLNVFVYIHLDVNSMTEENGDKYRLLLYLLLQYMCPVISTGDLAKLFEQYTKCH